MAKQPPNVNTNVTTEAESRASEHPAPQEVVMEPPAAVTKAKAAKEIKRRKSKSK